MWKHIWWSLAVVLAAAGFLAAADNSWRFPVPSLGGLTTGDLIYAQDANNLGNINAVAIDQVLTSRGVGVAPAYSARPRTTSMTFASSLTTHSYYGIANTETEAAYAFTNGYRMYASLVAGKPVVYIQFATGLPRPIATPFM